MMSFQGVMHRSAFETKIHWMRRDKTTLRKPLRILFSCSIRVTSWIALVFSTNDPRSHTNGTRTKIFPTPSRGI